MKHKTKIDRIYLKSELTTWEPNYCCVANTNTTMMEMTHGEKGHNIHIKINLCFDLFCSHRHDDFGPKRQQSNADHQFIFSLAVAIAAKQI